MDDGVLSTSSEHQSCTKTIRFSTGTPKTIPPTARPLVHASSEKVRVFASVPRRSASGNFPSINQIMIILHENPDLTVNPRQNPSRPDESRIRERVVQVMQAYCANPHAKRIKDLERVPRRTRSRKTP